MALRRKNKGRPRLLIYSDSRGRNLAGTFSNRHYEWSYVHRLQWRADTDYVVGPHSHTTILDFLNHVDEVGVSNYDFVLMHCGIVDFSPRPISNISVVRSGKSGVRGFDELFAENASYHDNPWPVLYNGEPTINLYSEEYLADALVPRLRAIPNLIWINSNHLVPGWDGNHKARPSNLDDVVSRFDGRLAPEVPRLVDLKPWSSSDIQRFTIDNVHFSRVGFRQIADMVEAQIK